MKTSDTATYREFESHTLRQKENPVPCGRDFLFDSMHAAETATQRLSIAESKTRSSLRVQPGLRQKPLFMGGLNFFEKSVDKLSKA